MLFSSCSPTSLKTRIFLLLSCLACLGACRAIQGTRPAPSQTANGEPPSTPAPVQTGSGDRLAFTTPEQTSPPWTAAVESPTSVSRAATAIDTPDSGALARQHVLALSESIGPRVAGSSQEAEAARYIEAAFQELGFIPSTQAFTATVKKGVEQSIISSANVIAVKAGNSPKTLIVGAHYDSVQVGRGADDNASGVAVLLAVAGMVRDAPTPYTIRFVAFGAEEVGLKGSTAYVDRMSQAEIAGTVAMINLDSLAAGDLAYIYGDGEPGASIREWALRKSGELGLELHTQPGENPEYPAGTTGDWSDHAPFKQAGVSYAYLESTNWSLGDKDGYTQTSPNIGNQGQIWHSSFDSIPFIEETFPGRLDQRLRLFTSVLFHILTGFP
jgi:acetylornithine deacetylase/succinyl-diaminopimelate desuccinylase-like protein